MITSNLDLEDLTFNSKEEVDTWCENTFIGVGKIVALDYKNKSLEKSNQISYIPSLAIFEELYLASKTAYRQLGIKSDPKKYTTNDLNERVFLPIMEIERRKEEMRDNLPVETPNIMSIMRDYADWFLRSINPIPSFYHR